MEIRSPSLGKCLFWCWTRDRERAITDALAGIRKGKELVEGNVFFVALEGHLGTTFKKLLEQEMRFAMREVDLYL